VWRGGKEVVRGGTGSVELRGVGRGGGCSLRKGRVRIR